MTVQPPEDPSAAPPAATAPTPAERQRRCAQLLEVVALAGGSAEDLCAALLQVGPGAEDCEVLKVRHTCM